MAYTLSADRIEQILMAAGILRILPLPICRKQAALLEAVTMKNDLATLATVKRNLRLVRDAYDDTIKRKELDLRLALSGVLRLLAP